MNVYIASITQSLRLLIDVTLPAQRCKQPCDGVGKTVIPSHVVCSPAMPRRSIPMFAQICIVTLLSGRALIKGRFQTSQSEPKRCCSDMGRYRDTGTVDDMRLKHTHLFICVFFSINRIKKYFFLLITEKHDMLQEI